MGRWRATMARARKTTTTNHQQPNKPTRTQRIRSKPQGGSKRTTKPTSYERVREGLTAAMKILLLAFMVITLVWAIYLVGERIGIPFHVAHALVLAIEYFERFFL